MSSLTPTRPALPLPGDPAPPFTQRTPANPQFSFDTAAGRYVALCFLGSAETAQSQAAIQAVLARPDLFNDVNLACFVVSNDPADETEGRLANRVPGFRVFWDFDLAISRLYGAVSQDAVPPALASSRFWLLADPTMRIIATIPFRDDGSDVAEFIQRVETLPPPARFAGIELQAPVLYLPNVFEPELCRYLIGLYETNGGHESGFMRDVGGRTIGISDVRHKRRKDYDIHDKNLIAALRSRVAQRVAPEIAKVHQFKVTRMERYIVSCYDALDGGHFAAHRDNTTAGTAHRRFAVSINLNDDFDGGEVSFPEYGPRSFKAPPGGAVVFSCSLLHKVGKVTRGRRFAFLPFLYDEAAAQLRQRNAALVGEKGSGYRAG